MNASRGKSRKGVGTKTGNKITKKDTGGGECGINEDMASDREGRSEKIR